MTDVMHQCRGCTEYREWTRRRFLTRLSESSARTVPVSVRYGLHGVGRGNVMVWNGLSR